MLQYPFNPLEEKEGLEVLEACRAHGVGFIAMKPFGGGMLDDASACVRFLLQYPDVAADPGFEALREVEEVVRLAEGPGGLTAADRAAIGRWRAELGGRFCHRCCYCQPCPQGVSIMPLMTMETILRRLPLETVRDGWPGQAAATAGGCTECGECEQRCPYGLPIRQRIREGVEVWRRVTAG